MNGQVNRGASTVEEIFSHGDRVVVHDHGRVRPAVIERHAPYRQRGNIVSDGYYVRYLDATEQWHSHGGWQPSSALQPDALPFGVDRVECLSEPFCACGRVISRCDGSRAGCRGSR